MTDDVPRPDASCDVCGVITASPPPLTWTLARSAAGERWICPDCTRANARSIEAKLDPAWW